MKIISFPRKVTHLLAMSSACFLIVSGLVAQPMKNSAPESDFINAQWSLGLAAGNLDDWYINCDYNHEKFPSGDFAQLNLYPDNTTYGFQQSPRDAPRNLIGNASLGYALAGITRYQAMRVSYGDNLYNQYRANQHFFYPAVGDTGIGRQARDLTYGMYPFVTQSIGASHSERDEVRKFFLGLAALRPDVKTILKDEGLLIPTLQMTHRRTRVASDAEYLTGFAHPSAFGNVANDYDMVVMANGITADKIPPLVQMELLEENFLYAHPNQFNDRYFYPTGEYLFTTPVAIGRLWRGPEFTKRMIVSVENSIDVNDHDLTFDFVVLRGDASKVRFTPLNAEGTLMQIEMDYFTTFTDPFTGELSNMLLIGVFANNGYYYSAPAFISCSTLWNESRSYGGDKQLDTITYLDIEVGNYVSWDRTWNKDHFTFDAYGRVHKYYREFSASTDTYSAEGFLVLEEDADGRPTKATRVTYSKNAGDDTTVAASYAETDWRYEMNYDYISASIPTNGSYAYTSDAANDSLSTVLNPTHGAVAIQYNNGLPPVYTYTPAPGFTGVDVFVVQENNNTLQDTTVLHKVRVVVGPTDTDAPAPVSNVLVIADSIDRARIIWGLPAENYEVAYFEVYRDGVLLGKAYGLEFEDVDVVPGQEYDYTIVAVDDAGNASVASAASTGGGATIWGQDNFNDNNYTVADGSLANCLTWTLLSGNVQSGLSAFRPGHNVSVPSSIIANQSITPPFTLDFTNNQKYCVAKNGPILLYQDADNYYHFTLNRDLCELYRRMDGVDTLIGSDSNLAMKTHAGSIARYQITVIAVDGVITFKVIKKEWTTLPDAVLEGFFYDANLEAFSRFTEGPIGFKQETFGTYSAAIYDDLYLSRMDGVGPDYDNDGLVDAWERAFFGQGGVEPGDLSRDHDNDGVSSQDERLWGSNPTSGGSNGAIVDPVGGPAAGQLSLSWPSLEQRLYTVWLSEDLQDWSEYPGLIDIAATPPANTVTIDLPEGAPGFFRISVTEGP